MPVRGTRLVNDIARKCAVSDCKECITWYSGDVCPTLCLRHIAEKAQQRANTEDAARAETVRMVDEQRHEARDEVKFFNESEKHASRLAVTSSLKWKLFEMRQIRDAFAWAEAGGVAVHSMGDVTGDAFKNAPNVFKGRKFAHLFGPSRDALIEAALSIGCKRQWIQKDDDPLHRHFDLTGAILRRALEKCSVDAR